MRGMRVTQDFSGVRWWCADDELIDNDFDKLPLLTPEAYHYYLPAFLLRALVIFEPDNPVPQFCLFDLSSNQTSNDDPWRRARMNEFSSEEIAVVAGFLEIVLQDERFFSYYPEAQAGLEQYWHV